MKSLLYTMLQNKKLQKGFTLIELLVVIAIIGILSTLAIVALSDVRAKARDAKRVADVQQISKALDLYYADYGIYPTIITPGQAILSPDGSKTYMAAIPNNPTPRNDNGCGNDNYTYAASSNNSDYALHFCLSGASGSLGRGINSASTAGVGTAPGLVGWWKFEETSGSSTADVTGNGNACAIQGSQAKIDYFRGGLSECKNGLCAKFDGSNELYLNCGTTDDFLLNSGSFSMWFNPASGISGNNNRLIDIGNAAASQRIGLFWGAGRIYLYGVKDNSAILNTSILLTTTNTWYFVAGTWGVNGGYIYVKNTGLDTNNGALGDVRMTLPAGSTRLFIGNFIAGSAGYTWNGAIDDVRIYDRVLSTTEIQAIYDATK